MTKYEYDTLIVDRNNVDKFDAELKQRVEEGFEVFNTQMAVSGSSIHLAYFLRKEITGPITHQSVSMEQILELRELSHKIIGVMINAPENDSYQKALEQFYFKADEVLGLK